MRSMTGFGAATCADASVSVTVEVRSVNHRFLQVKSRVPAELADLESEVDAAVKKRLVRGSVNATVRVEPVGTAAEVRVDTALVARYRTRLAELAQAAGAPDDQLALVDWTRLPGVLETRTATYDPKKVARVVAKATNAALDQLVAMRESEGVAMAKDLAKHAAALAKLVERIAARAPKAVRHLQTELRARVAQLLDRAALDPDDLAREVAALADRADVAEELARLDAHLEAFSAVVANEKQPKDGVGRRLDFLVQEIFREINTIGSKASDAKIAHLVVDAKTTSERLREQVQNVE